MTEVPPEITEYLNSPHTLPEWVHFYSAFPTVTAAVRAASKGGTVEVFTSENTAYVQRVILIEGKPVIETVIYPTVQARDALVAAFLNHGTKAAETLILDAQPHLLPAGPDLTGYECITEPGEG
ncbi:hypothetical protein, partial [Actinomadura kijaniata]|uniref:hypothetical protein n=1 Tax=Actinomadura kijaniata TaxID=46161 RepID=UPI0031DFCEA6